MAAQPAADARRVGELPAKGKGHDEGADGRHAGVEDEGREDGAVEVVRREHSGHGPVAPGERLGELELGGQGAHDVEERDEAGRLHDEPGPFAGDVEARGRRGFARWVPVGEPLDGGDLGRGGRVSVELVGGGWRWGSATW